ncbi:hypothetical protein ACMDZ0_000063 [Enterococcus hirae]
MEQKQKTQKRAFVEQNPCILGSNKTTEGNKGSIQDESFAMDE